MPVEVEVDLVEAVEPVEVAEVVEVNIVFVRVANHAAVVVASTVRALAELLYLHR